MPESPLHWTSVALEELKELQAIVSRHEEHAFKVRGYLYVIIGAMTTSLFLEKPYLSPVGYAGGCAIAIVLFMIMELIHRCYAARAIARVSDVEKALRGELDYRGPQICTSMRAPAGGFIREMKVEFEYPTVPLHYALLGAFVAAVALIGQ